MRCDPEVLLGPVRLPAVTEHSGVPSWDVHAVRGWGDDRWGYGDGAASLDR